MKQYTSKFLKAISWVYISFPIHYLLWVAVLFDIPLARIFSVLLMPLFYFVSFWAVLAGYGLWEMKRWSWYVFIAANILITYETAYLLTNYGESHHKVLAFLFFVFPLLMVTYRIRREVRVPYFLPRIAWWESNPRYRLSVPVKMEDDDSQIVRGSILDISVAGCFVKVQDSVVRDTLLKLKFNVFGQILTVRGRVVWKTESSVTHPRGIGIKFIHLTRIQKRRLRVATNRLNRISSLYRRSKFVAGKEDFLERLENLKSMGFEEPDL